MMEDKWCLSSRRIASGLVLDGCNHPLEEVTVASRGSKMLALEAQAKTAVYFTHSW